MDNQTAALVIRSAVIWPECGLSNYNNDWAFEITILNHQDISVIQVSHDCKTTNED